MSKLANVVTVIKLAKNIATGFGCEADVSHAHLTHPLERDVTRVFHSRHRAVREVNILSVDLSVVSYKRLNLVRERQVESVEQAPGHSHRVQGDRFKFRQMESIRELALQPVEFNPVECHFVT